MPRVPQYGERRVAPTPGARGTAAPNIRRADGSAALNSAVKLAGQAAELEREEMKRANDAVIKMKTAEMYGAYNDLDNNYRNLQGEEAVNKSKVYDDDFKKRMDDVVGKAHNPYQKAALENARGELAMRWANSSQRHFLNERKRLHMQSVDSLISLEGEEALERIADAKGFKAYLSGKWDKTLEQKARLEGWDKNTKKLQINAAYSDLLLKGATALIDSGHSPRARELLADKELSKRLDADTRMKIKTMLDEGDVVAKALHKADVYWGKTGGDVRKAMNMADADKEELRPLIRAAIHKRKRMQDHRRSEDARASFARAKLVLDSEKAKENAGDDPQLWMGTAWSGLDPAQKAAVKKLHMGAGRTNMDRFSRFLRQPASALKAMGEQEFLVDYYAHLDEADRKYARAEFDAAKKKGAFESVLTRKERTDRIARRYGLLQDDKMNNSEKEAYVGFKRAVNERFLEWEIAGGKKLEDASEQDRIIREVARDSIEYRVDKPWRFDPSRRFAELEEDEKGRVWVAYSKIPPEWLERARMALERKGWKVTNYKLQRMYAMSLIGASPEDVERVGREE